VADVESTPGPLPAIVACAVEHGARAVVLRMRQADRGVREALTAAVRDILGPVDGLLIVAGPPSRETDAMAMHLTAIQATPDPRPSMMGRSCHNSAEVVRAANEGCDYIFVSPVYETASKPGYGPALGPVGLAALSVHAPMPVFALGGVLPEHVAECRKSGAYGVAVMGPVLRHPPVVDEYLHALEECS
jgi:thiamine-phosphate pyrophosphorylase